MEISYESEVIYLESVAAVEAQRAVAPKPAAEVVLAVCHGVPFGLSCDRFGLSCEKVRVKL